MQATTQRSSWHRRMTIEPRAEDATVTEGTLTADLSDGRTLSVSLDWQPRLVHAAEQEREATGSSSAGARGFAGAIWTRTSMWRRTGRSVEGRDLNLYELMPAERKALQGN